MKFLIFLLLITLVNCVPDAATKTKFNDFKKKFNKKYKNTDEDNKKLEAFAKNLAQIEAHNAKKGTLFKMAVYEDADLTEEEFVKLKTGWIENKQPPKRMMEVEARQAVKVTTTKRPVTTTTRRVTTTTRPASTTTRPASTTTRPASSTTRPIITTTRKIETSAFAQGQSTMQQIQNTYTIANNSCTCTCSCPSTTTSFTSTTSTTSTTQTTTNVITTSTSTIITGTTTTASTRPTTTTPFVIPREIDWRTRGFVTPVKNQGGCGSCWAFSAVGAIEGQWYRRYGTLPNLSEQFLVDCSTRNGGCGGGLMHTAFLDVSDLYGMPNSTVYPYKAVGQTCVVNKDHRAATVTEYVQVPRQNETQLELAVATVGPVAVAVFVNSQFSAYANGILPAIACNTTSINHGVLIVGYNNTNNPPYWIVKNSWGSGWGNGGYINVEKGKNTCSIANYAVYPIV